MRLMKRLLVSLLLYQCSDAAKVPTAKPSTSPFYVYPKVATDSTSNGAILAQLKRWVPDDETISICQLGTDLSYVNFWLVSLTKDQSNQLNGTSTVGTVAPQCTTDCDDLQVTNWSGEGNKTSEHPSNVLKRAPDPGFATQANSVPEMVFISQPKLGSGGIELSLMNGQYVYEQSSGLNTNVYMIDSGADPNNPEFIDLQHDWRWMGPDYTRTETGVYTVSGIPGDWPTNDHGTRVLSKIGGKKYGASKRLKTIIARTPNPCRVEDSIEAVNWVIDDWKRIRNTENVKVAIINMSWGTAVGANYVATDELHRFRFKTLGSLLSEAVKEGLLPICASGNTRELLVVGAVDNTGKFWDEPANGIGTMMADYVSLFAPGVNVWLAKNRAPDAQESGTSFSTATMSGLAAYLAALPSFSSRWTPRTTWPERVSDVSNELMSRAYSRNSRGGHDYPLAIWNGVTRVGDCQGQPMKFKRDGSPVCSIQPSTSPPYPTTSASSSPSSLQGTAAPPSPPKSASSPKTTVQVGKNPVMVGNLNGPNLYTAVLRAMTPSCPTSSSSVSNCNSAGATISDVGFVEGGVADTGELVITINDSNYTSTAQRDGMIALVASTMKSSATGKNCSPDKYEEGCNAKRALVPGSAAGKCIHSSMTTCTAPDTVDIQITDGDAGIVAFMDVGIAFKIPGETFICDEIIAVVDAAIALVPEADPALIEELGEITALCGEIEANIKHITGAGPP